MSPGTSSPSASPFGRYLYERNFFLRSALWHSALKLDLVAISDGTGIVLLRLAPTLSLTDTIYPAVPLPNLLISYLNARLLAIGRVPVLLGELLPVGLVLSAPSHSQTFLNLRSPCSYCRAPCRRTCCSSTCRHCHG